MIYYTDNSLLNCALLENKLLKNLELLVAMKYVKKVYISQNYLIV